MILFILGCFIGSIFTLFVMSLMIVSKNEDLMSEKYLYTVSGE